jgi:hypothetical protein
MPNIVDGSFDTPEGRKVFVQRRSGESVDAFAERALALMIRSGSAFLCEHDPVEDGSFLPR